MGESFWLLVIGLLCIWWGIVLTVFREKFETSFKNSSESRPLMGPLFGTREGGPFPMPSIPFFAVISLLAGATFLFIALLSTG